jgi:alpha-L-rhamnosidase
VQINRSNVCLLGVPWSAKWIASPDTSCRSPLFRKRFNLTSVPSRACAFICGLGYFELYLNGRRVGDHVLDPAQTDYETRALYVGHDVTELLVAGGNAVGVMLGNGFFNQDRVWGGMSYGLPRMIFQLHMEESEKPIVVSDASWLTTAGPVIENNVYAGETYDARCEIEKWCEVGCDESKWVAAKEVESPTKTLEPQTMPPVRRMKTLEPVKINKLPSGATIFDFGQNFAGWTKLRVAGARAGAPIRLRSAESVNADGTLDSASTGVFATRVEQIDTYVPEGAGG